MCPDGRVFPSVNRAQGRAWWIHGVAPLGRVRVRGGERRRGSRCRRSDGRSAACGRRSGGHRTLLREESRRRVAGGRRFGGRWSGVGWGERVVMTGSRKERTRSAKGWRGAEERRARRVGGVGARWCSGWRRGRRWSRQCGGGEVAWGGGRGRDGATSSRARCKERASSWVRRRGAPREEGGGRDGGRDGADVYCVEDRGGARSGGCGGGCGGGNAT